MANELIRKKTHVTGTGEVISVPVEKKEGPGTKPADLRSPDTTKVTITEGGRVTERRDPSLVSFRVDPGTVDTKGRKGRVRQARLKVRVVKALNRLERASFGQALGELDADLGALRLDPSLREGRMEQVSGRLHRAMKEARVSKADKKYQDLAAVGLDHLVVDVLLAGELSMDRARSELDRLRGLLADRQVKPETIKNGIVAFDELTQYLALASDQVSYPTDRNRARDHLTAYASALHR